MIKLPRLVGIAGKAGCGKDTAANFLCTRYGFNKYSLSTPIKHALNAMYNWEMSYWNNREWKERIIPGLGKSPRQLAQTLGTEWGRECVSLDIWLEFLQRRWKYLNEQSMHDLNVDMPSLVVPDIRFSNEADWITKNDGVVVRIDRVVDGVSRHASECSLDEACIDIVVNNDCEIIRFLQRFQAGLVGIAHAANLDSEWHD